MKLAEHEMLVTLANMALKMDDLTRHDVLEALDALGFGSVVTEARESSSPKFNRRAVRPTLQWFAECMEEKLRANDHKEHWSKCDFPYLDRRLDDEVLELKGARTRIAGDSASPETVEAAIGEAVDVANFAMMIADNARNLLK